MAVPMVAAAALAAAGTGAQMAASAEAQGAANDATQAELRRQAQYQKRSSALFQQSLGQSDPASSNTQIKQGEDRANQAYAAAQAAPPSVSAAPQLALPGAQNVVQDQRNALSTTMSNARAARLAGYNEWDLQQAIKDLKTKNMLGVVSREASSSANVLPSEINAALHSWDDLSAAGTGLSLASSLVGLYGMGSAMSAAGAAGGSVPFATVAANQANPYTSLGIWSNLGPYFGSGAAL